MKMAFHSNTLGWRGSEQSVWDYAHLSEKLLGHDSVICFQARAGMEQQPAFIHWGSRFRLLPYIDLGDLQKKLAREQVEMLYWIKPGPYDGNLIPGIKNCIHAMFLTDEFHGDAFSYVSPWCAEVMTGQRLSYVPHLVTPHPASETLRAKLGIPIQARVFGRHGAFDTFNIPFARRAVRDHARKNPQDHFVFLNTEVIPGTRGLGNIHYLPATNHLKEKGRFLATCDAMLHARWHGETFGLAVGEFAVLGKPVITYGGSRERAHLDMLGTQAQIYGCEEELRRILQAFEPRPVWGTGYEPWADPQAVMRIFQQRFLGTTA